MKKILQLLFDVMATIIVLCLVYPIGLLFILLSK